MIHEKKELVQKCIGYLAAKIDDGCDKEITYGYLLLIRDALVNLQSEIHSLEQLNAAFPQIVDDLRKNLKDADDKIEKLRLKSYPISRFKKNELENQLGLQIIENGKLHGINEELYMENQRLKRRVNLCVDWFEKMAFTPASLNIERETVNGGAE